MKYKNDLNQKIIYLGILPLLFALYGILKVFYLPHCYAFDSNDEANHTFPNLFTAFRLLSSGALPLMNLSNNFGTPLMGDGLSFPFSIFAVTYKFFSGPLASTINRFLVINLTLITLTVYYRRYATWPIASLCAFLMFLTPGVFWNIAHHHYQSTVLFTALLLLFQERLADQFDFKNAFFFYLAAILFCLSTSANLVVYGFSFVLANSVFHKSRCQGKFIALSFTLIAAAVILCLPEFRMFFSELASATRKAEFYGEPMVFKEFILSILGGAVITFIQQYWHYISWPLLSMLGLSLYFLCVKEADKSFNYKVLCLGVLPLLFVFTALGNTAIYQKIPFLHATDITRIFWISNIFMMLILAKGLQFLNDSKVSKTEQLFFLAVYAVYICAMQLWVGWRQIPWQYSLSVFAFFAAWALYLLLLKKPRARKICLLCLLLGLFLTRVPVFYLILGQGSPKDCRVNYSHWYSSVEQAYYPEPEIMNFVEPFSRMTHEEETYWGRDFRLVYHDLFGAQARTPLIHSGMYDYLKNEKLIQKQEWLINYYFVRPWRADRFRELGIRYLITREGEESVATMGWRPLARHGEVVLLENPLPTSVVYLEGEGKMTPIDAVRDIDFWGNGFQVELPALDKKMDLVAAFIHRPDWHATVDGQKRSLRHSENQLMRVSVGPDDKSVWFEYAPFTWQHILICFVISLSLFCFVLSKIRSKSAFDIYQ